MQNKIQMWSSKHNISEKLNYISTLEKNITWYNFSMLEVTGGGKTCQ